ncbi:MAG: DUF1893 domain-containing protein [Candidatus Limimorpha sp.]
MYYRCTLLGVPAFLSFSSVSMMNTVDELKELLLSGSFSLVVKKNDRLFTSSDKGVKPLLSLLLSQPEMLLDATLADKVIGKAAALLMVKGGVKEVFGSVVSAPAMLVFQRYNVVCHHDTLVERIYNRTGDGLCPMESLCLNVDDPETAFLLISEKIKSFTK